MGIGIEIVAKKLAETLKLLLLPEKISTKSAQVVYGLLNEENNNYEFTAREMQCLYYLLRGQTAKLIAQHLFLSSRTVESHINNIKIKLQCTARAQLIDKALSSGLFKILPTEIFHRIVA